MGNSDCGLRIADCGLRIAENIQRSIFALFSFLLTLTQVILVIPKSRQTIKHNIEAEL
jgi:hypothetical protein